MGVYDKELIKLEAKKEYLKDLCNQLQSFIDSNKKILVINMPPRL